MELDSAFNSELAQRWMLELQSDFGRGMIYFAKELRLLDSLTKNPSIWQNN